LLFDTACNAASVARLGLVFDDSMGLAACVRRKSFWRETMQMYKNIAYGMLAGILATCLLSLLTLSGGLVPQFKLVNLLIGITQVVLDGSGLPAPFAGWLWFFAIGGLWWGAWFAIIAPIIPGRSFLIKGAVFGLVIGFVVIWTIMPLAAGGALGMRLSLLQPVVTLIEHLIYGLALGLIYSRLTAR
jgi:hypothetical protein